MKFASNLAVALGALLALSAGCKDAVQPEPPSVEPPVTPPVVPSVAPPGELVFRRHSEGQIYRVNLDGTGLTQMTTSGDNGGPVWSPDGRRIAFAKNVPGPSNRGFGKSDIYTMDADGSNVVRHTTDGNFDYPAWSPDGRKLAITDNRIYRSDIYLVSADGDGSGPIHLATDAAWPGWSPDGKQLVFVRISGDDGYDHIAVMNADGTGARPLTAIDPGSIGGLTWSPNGQRIAFSKCLSGSCDVYTMHPDGSQITQITKEGNAGGATWSPDGAWIAFTISNYSGREWQPSIAYAPVGGGTPRIVADGSNPSWRP